MRSPTHWISTKTLSLFLILVFLSSASPLYALETETAKVLSVVDGDTLKIKYRVLRGFSRTRPLLCPVWLSFSGPGRFVRHLSGLWGWVCFRGCRSRKPCTSNLSPSNTSLPHTTPSTAPPHSHPTLLSNHWGMIGIVFW